MELQKEKRVQVDISIDKLEDLLRKRVICASDINFINTDSKNQLRASCLNSLCLV